MENDRSIIKKAKERIDKMSTGDFDGSEGSYGINYENPLTTSPSISEQAYIARRLALELPFRDEYLKAKWQKYWLSCCISPKCDYIFAELEEIGVDREKDIFTIWDKGILWKYLGSKYGMAYYHDQCQKFLLKRYALWQAVKLAKYKKCSITLINLFLPRLIGTILIGFLVLITAEEIWQFPSKLYAQNLIGYVFLVFLSFFIPYLYLFIECRNTTGKISLNKILGRSFWIWFIGALYSLFLSFCIVVPSVGPYIVDPSVTCFQTKLLFASLALFIGIFIQVFWEEKTITEPL